MVPRHLLPIFGENQIYDIITHFRDLIQFVNDHTIRFFNNGHDVDDILKKYNFPQSQSLIHTRGGNVSRSDRIRPGF